MTNLYGPPLLDVLGYDGIDFLVRVEYPVYGFTDERMYDPEALPTYNDLIAKRGAILRLRPDNFPEYAPDMQLVHVTVHAPAAKEAHDSGPDL